jgi:hypothetical protein
MYVHVLIFLQPYKPSRKTPERKYRIKQFRFYFIFYVEKRDNY